MTKYQYRDLSIHIKVHFTKPSNTNADDWFNGPGVYVRVHANDGYEALQMK